MDKPVIITFGGGGQSTMWAKLSEHAALAFVNSNAAQLARDLGSQETAAIEGTLELRDKNKARNLSVVLASRTLDLESPEQFEVPALNYPQIMEWLPGFASEIIMPSIMQTIAMQKLFDEHKVVGILTHEDVTAVGRLLSLFGKARNIPVLHMPHANHFIQAGTKDVHCSNNSDHIGAAGEYMKQWYIANGATDIEIVGSPSWDVLYNEEKNPPREHARRVFAVEGKLVVTYATTWAQETASWGSGQQDVDLGYLYMLEAARKLKCFLLVKMHPGEAQGREQYYGTLMRKHGVEGCVTRAHNKQVLRASDCVVTQGSSNFAVEAAILGAPVVELFQCGTRYPKKYDIPGTWGGGLDTAIRSAIEAGPPVEFAKDMSAGPGATERAIEWVLDKCQIK